MHRIESLNAFTAATGAAPSCGCSPAPHDAHAHPSALALCRRCGAVQDIEDTTLGAVLDVASSRTGHRVEGRVAGMVGPCPACAARDGCLRRA